MQIYKNITNYTLKYFFNPINLYKVSLLRAMDWVLFWDRLTARNLTKSHSKSSKNVSAGAGLLFSPLFERKSINLWKLFSLRGLAGYGVGSNPINLYKSSGSLYGIAASRDGLGSFWGSPDGEKSHKISFKIKQKCLGWRRSLYSLPCGRKSINLWKLLSLRGLAGYGVGSNPINLYKVSLLRAMDWVRLTQVLGPPLWRAEIYKSMEIIFLAGIGRVRGQIKSYKSFLI